jgi:glycosyltransferase involved in cell wall biosynthesis
VDSTNKLKISAVIISKNEEKMIERCLSSLDFIEDVVLIDAESTDSTRDIAAKFNNVRVIVRPWPGFRAQRNFSLTVPKYDWVLVVMPTRRQAQSLK